MQYVTGDLHGYPLSKFKRLLDKVKFSDDDDLIIVGDVIDRGSDAVEDLRYIMQQANMELLLGNHEDMLLKCSFLFDEITEENVRDLTQDKLRSTYHWLSNGGQVTMDALSALARKRPDEVNDILSFLFDCPLFACVDTDDHSFLMTHAGLGNYRPNKRLREYEKHDLIWHRPTMDERWSDDFITVFGHTPVQYLTGHMDEENWKPGRMVRTETWIDIDTGASAGLSPMLLRLEDLRPFYADED